MARVTVFLVFLAMLMVGGVLLQIFLSKRESKWPGLVLPGVCFLYSLVMVLNMAAMGNVKSVIAAILTTLITGNIPTLILLAIYAACRGGRRKTREMDRMNIDDL